MSLNADELVGYLRAARDKSSRLRVAQFLVQILIAVPAALSVVVIEPVYSYILAVLGGVLLLVWLTVNLWYGSERNSTQTARRAALLVGGLDRPLSPAGILSLQDRLKVSSDDARRFQKIDYYSTSQPAGSARLAEMIEESAFYSAPLQRISARVMLAILLGFAIVAAGIALTCSPSAPMAQIQG